jgi:hypothetical protein
VDREALCSGLLLQQPPCRSFPDPSSLLSQRQRQVCVTASLTQLGEGRSGPLWVGVLTRPARPAGVPHPSPHLHHFRAHLVRPGRPSPAAPPAPRVGRLRVCSSSGAGTPFFSRVCCSSKCQCQCHETQFDVKSIAKIENSAVADAAEGQPCTPSKFQQQSDALSNTLLSHCTMLLCAWRDWCNTAAAATRSSSATPNAD